MSNLAEIELSALRELMEAICPGLGAAMTAQLGCEVGMNVAQISAVPIADVLERSDSVLSTAFSLTQPMGAESLFLLAQSAACTACDLMDGGDGSSPPDRLTDEDAQKLVPALQEALRELATALSLRTGEVLDIESSNTHGGPLTLPPVFALEGSAVHVELRLTLGGLYESDASFLFTPEWVRILSPAAAPAADKSNSAETLSEEELAAMLNDIGGLGGSAPAMPGLSVSASANPFPSFPMSGQESNLPRGMDLIMDIPLDVTVELGRVRMLIKDVLELASGSIVELDRVAGEPVDLLVNGRLVAKGEVVVIEDNFGIRITEIVSPADRVANLGKGR